MADKQLMTVEQKIVEFNGDSLTAVRIESGEIYVPIRPICINLGLDWSSQRRRIKRDDVLSKYAMSVAVMATDIDPDSKRPHSNQMIALPLHYMIR